MKEGLFITFEGLDGAGKSTQIKMVGRYLGDIGVGNVLVTAEPGGTTVGDELREVVHSFWHSSMDPITELFAYCGSRAQLVEEKIKPHLASGGLVLCDRYGDSTLAYQGYGRGLPMGDVADCVRIAMRGVVPNLTILFDLEPSLGLARRRGSEGWNRMDAQTLDFYEKVRAGYLKMAKEGGRWKLVDAGRSREEVFEEVKGLVVACLGLV